MFSGRYVQCRRGVGSGSKSKDVRLKKTLGVKHVRENFIEGDGGTRFGSLKVIGEMGRLSSIDGGSIVEKRGN